MEKAIYKVAAQKKEKSLRIKLSAVIYWRVDSGDDLGILPQTQYIQEIVFLPVIPSRFFANIFDDEHLIVFTHKLDINLFYRWGDGTSRN